MQQTVTLDESVSESSMDEMTNDMHLHKPKKENKDDDEHKFYAVKSMESLYKDNLPGLGL